MYVRTRTYKDKRTGERKMCTNHTVYFRDHNEVKRELTGFGNRRATLELGRQVGCLVECRAAGCGPDLELARWLEMAPHRIKERLVAWGLLEPARLAASRPLVQHLADWKGALLAKGDTREHADLVTARARKVLTGCGFKFYRDISASRLQQYLADMRTKLGISAQTFNFYLQAAKQFCRWMVRDRRASDNPITHLAGLNVRTDRRHDRRALSIEEVRNLLAATESGPKRFKMVGLERALLYRLALETGLRANEIRSLTKANFDFDTIPPTVTVEAGYSKHRREDVLPLRQSMAAAMREHLAYKMPATPVFTMPRSTSRMIQADLRAAGIPYCDATGRYADFHALRHTFITNLVRGDVHPAVAQTLARHSTITLTMNRYTHIMHSQQVAALAKLPDLSVRHATGTEGKA